MGLGYLLIFLKDIFAMVNLNLAAESFSFMWGSTFLGFFSVDFTTDVADSTPILASISLFPNWIPNLIFQKDFSILEDFKKLESTSIFQALSFCDSWQLT